MCGKVCVAASRGGVGTGSGRRREVTCDSAGGVHLNLWMGSTECDLWARHRT